MNVFRYNSQEDEELLNFYQQVLNELNVSYKLMRIETTYGDTDVLIIGDKKLHPLVFLNDLKRRNSHALDLVIELLNDFRVYSIDVSDQPNISNEICLSMNDDSFGKWMHEILSRLGVRNVFLTGNSMGGFAALKAMAFDETKISKAFLINPMGIVPECASDVPLISKKEAESIKTPLCIFATENKLLFQGRIFPSLNETVLLESSIPVFSEHHIKKIAEIIRNYIRL